VAGSAACALALGLSRGSVSSLQLHPLAVVPVPGDGCLLKKSVVNALMIDRRRLWSAIRTVMAEDEFLVHRRDFPQVHHPALPGVEEPVVRGCSDLVRVAIAVASEYQDRAPAAAGAQDSPSALSLAEEFALNHVAGRSVLLRLGNRAVAALEDGSHPGGQLRIVLDSKPSDRFVRISGRSAQSTEQTQQHEKLSHDVLTLKRHRLVTNRRARTMRTFFFVTPVLALTRRMANMSARFVGVM